MALRSQWSQWTSDRLQPWSRASMTTWRPTSRITYTSDHLAPPTPVIALPIASDNTYANAHAPSRIGSDWLRRVNLVHLGLINRRISGLSVIRGVGGNPRPYLYLLSVYRDKQEIRSRGRLFHCRLPFITLHHVTHCILWPINYSILFYSSHTLSLFYFNSCMVHI